MNIDDYRNAIRDFAIYPEANSCSKNELMYLALGLCGETGEVAEKIKKVYRDNKALNHEELAKELGDVAWYWARLCEAIQFRCEDVLGMNVNKLNSRKARNVLEGSGDNR